MKLKHLFLVLVAFFLVPSVASAFSCKISQSPNESDECYQLVRIASDETTLVSEGMVLVYDILSGSPNQGASQVELADASAENVIVAGIAGYSVASGEVTNIQVRGKANVKLKGNITAGDPLYTSTTEGSLSGVASTGPQVGFALETGSDETIEAYLTIV